MFVLLVAVVGLLVGCSFWCHSAYWSMYDFLTCLLLECVVGSDFLTDVQSQAVFSSWYLLLWVEVVLLVIVMVLLVGCLFWCRSVYLLVSNVDDLVVGPHLVAVCAWCRWILVVDGNVLSCWLIQNNCPLAGVRSKVETPLSLMGVHSTCCLMIVIQGIKMD
jgi:hypothetical protein